MIRARRTRANAKSDFWIGAQLSSHRQGETFCETWYWTDQNRLMTFTDWDFGEPGYDGCAYAKFTNGLWSTSGCDIKKPYFCSVRPTINVCPDEWMLLGSTKACYKVFYEYYHWQAAEYQCQNQSAHLVSIHSDDENRFVQSISQAGYYFGSSAEGISKTWIGISTTSNDSTNYQWSDGTSFDYIKWQKGEPDYPKLEKCGQMDADPYQNITAGLWSNGVCDTPIRNYVCKKNSTIVKIFS
uniref:C-type lectin domain-containing protein n=1 Tax=Panagrolaimus sp. JU765 TaxID=591449 RepID=A0AC34Q891_9BILA